MDRNTPNTAKNISALDSLFQLLDEILVNIQDTMVVEGDDEIADTLDVYDAIVKLRDDILDVKAKLRRRGVVVEFPYGATPNEDGAIAVDIHWKTASSTTTTTTTTTTDSKKERYPYGGGLN